MLEDAVISGGVSDGERIGNAFRQAVAQGGDYVSAVLAAGAGKAMFEGVVKQSGYETKGGYTFGDTVIEGTGSFEGHTLRIWYQNENIISWLDGEYYVTVPDLICVFNLNEAMPQLNPYSAVGDRVSVIALPAPMEWRTTRGLEVFGPRSFGHDVEYSPFCGCNSMCDVCVRNEQTINAGAA